jgi:hypothetical protein
MSRVLPPPSSPLGDLASPVVVMRRGMLRRWRMLEWLLLLTLASPIWPYAALHDLRGEDAAALAHALRRRHTRREPL